jgi:hypothetical protein
MSRGGGLRRFYGISLRPGRSPRRPAPRPSFLHHKISAFHTYFANVRNPHVEIDRLSGAVHNGSWAGVEMRGRRWRIVQSS